LPLPNIGQNWILCQSFFVLFPLFFKAFLAFLGMEPASVFGGGRVE